MEIVLIRHTRTAVDRGFIAGWTEVPLAESFPAEAEMILAHVGKLPGDCLISSPSERCVALARLIGTPRIDERFREVNFGQWEGCRWDDIAHEELTPWMENFVTEAPPEGESARDLAERVQAGLESLDSSISRVIVIAHAGTLRTAAAYFLGLPLEKMFHLACEPGSILRARRTSHGWEVLEWFSPSPSA